MTETIMFKIYEKVLEDLVRLTDKKNPKQTNKNLMDYYIGIEKITQK